MQNTLMDQQLAPAGEAETGLMRSINLRDIWAPVYRSRFAVIAIFVVMLALAIVASLLITPVYRATATVEIRAETEKVLGTEDRNTGAAAPIDAQRFLDTQLNIIRSRSTTIAVAQALGFYNNNNFLIAMGVDPVAGQPGGANAEAHRRQVNQVLMSNLDVSFDEETRIADIEFASPDPKIAERVANSYADNYIRLNLARGFDASSYSLEFLRDQLREAQLRLANSEREAIEYARRSRLIDATNAASGTSGSGPQSLTTASLVSLSQALSEATTKRIAAEQRWRIASGGPVASIPEVVGNPTVQTLQQQQAGLRSQYEQELQTRRADYPSVRQLRARIDALERQIATAAGNVRNTIRREYETAAAQETALRANIEQLKSVTLDEQNRSVQLSILRREADTNRQQFAALLNRYNELNAQSGIQLNNLSIIDRAETPTSPFWPSVPLNIALAIILGILVSAIYVIGRENLFEIVRTPDDIRNRLRLPMLGAVPADPNVMAQMDDPKSSVSESLNSIRTSLSLSSSTGIPKSLMVTSTQAGEGKSTVCFGLAQSIAKLGHSVVLIDADLRRPNVHRLFGVANAKGVSNILSGGTGINDVLIRDERHHVDAIVAGPIPPDASELLATESLRRLIDELKARYDHVIVDSAPVLGLADASLVATSVDAMIYVVEASRTSVRGVQDATNRLRETKTPFAGAVLSRFQPEKSGYGHQYQYAYNYSYGQAPDNRG